MWLLHSTVICSRVWYEFLAHNKYYVRLKDHFCIFLLSGVLHSTVLSISTTWWQFFFRCDLLKTSSINVLESGEHFADFFMERIDCSCSCIFRNMCISKGWINYWDVTWGIKGVSRCAILKIRKLCNIRRSWFLLKSINSSFKIITNTVIWIRVKRISRITFLNNLS